jgi:hypothetical protein
MFFSKKTNSGVEKAQLFSEIVQENLDILSPISTVEDVLALGYVLVDQPTYPQTGKDYKPGIPSLVGSQYVGVWIEQETPNYERRKAVLSKALRRQRDEMIKAVAWRYERYARFERLGLEQVDSLQLLDTYIQQLADTPEQEGFPFSVNWPTLDT